MIDVQSTNIKASKQAVESPGRGGSCCSKRMHRVLATWIAQVDEGREFHDVAIAGEPQLSKSEK